MRIRRRNPSRWDRLRRAPNALREWAVAAMWIARRLWRHGKPQRLARR